MDVDRAARGLTKVALWASIVSLAALALAALAFGIFVVIVASA